METERARFTLPVPVALLPALTGILIALLVGCETTIVRPASPLQIRQFAEHKGVSDVIVPFELNDEMRDWVHDEVPSSVDRDLRLHVLAERLLAKDGRGIDYDGETTGTAEEVFYSGDANCLAFTHLFIGMARELGLNVFFLTVRDFEQYEKDGDLVVISDHIAVGYGPLHTMTIIDFAAEDQSNYRQIKPISDVTATALFYSNRGAERLRKGELAEANSWLNKAVLIDPTLVVAWINLGVVQRRLQQFEDAENSYRTALELQPTATSAYYNLSALLKLRGNEEEAEELLHLMDTSRNRNPFSYVALGDLSLRYGRSDEATRYYKRAIRLKDDLAAPMAALGQLELEQGRMGEAEKWLKKAMRIDADEPRVKQLESALRRGRIEG